MTFDQLFTYNVCMKIDKFGQPVYNENDLCDLYYKDPFRSISQILTDSDIHFDEILDLTAPNIIKYSDIKLNIKEFDIKNQSDWFFPERYKNFDIAKYILGLCNTPEELQRAGEELLLFQEREMFELLIYLKYLVDIMRENNIVWGVGRGSSVASFVLFLLGVHKINSLYYDLPINEFLK